MVSCRGLVLGAGVIVPEPDPLPPRFSGRVGKVSSCEVSDSMPEMLTRNPKDGYEMVWVPPGKAIFGSGADDRDARDDEEPQFEAELEGYYIGRFCVTNEQYAAFLNAVTPGASELAEWLVLGSHCHVVKSGGGYALDDGGMYEDHPVVTVSWFGAEAYCSWAGLRWPSELEWEKGARGCDGKKFPWGAEWNAEYCRHSGNRGGETTCRVWEYPEGVSRPWGCYNMGGNVWEWCADWYEEGVYKRYARGDLTPPGSGSLRVVRGGSWGSGAPVDFRCADRCYGDPSYRFDYDGFRCARGPAEAEV